MNMKHCLTDYSKILRDSVQGVSMFYLFALCERYVLTVVQLSPLSGSSASLGVHDVCTDERI